MIKNSIILLIIICVNFLPLQLTSQHKKPYWQDIDAYAINKEYPRTAFMSYDKKNDALDRKSVV